MEEFLSMLPSKQLEKVEKIERKGLTVESIADGIVTMVGGPSGRIMITPEGKKKKVN